MMEDTFREQAADLLKQFRKTVFLNDMNITDLKQGYAEIEVPVTANMMNPIHSVHGGVLFTLADSAAGMAAGTFGLAVTTMNASVQYLRPGMNTRTLRAGGTVVKHGEHVTVVTVSVRDQDEKELAIGTFSFMALKDSFHAFE